MNDRVASGDFINESTIHESLGRLPACDPVRVRETLAKAGELQGLDAADAAVLMGIETPDLLEELFAAANRVKEEIYGSRLVLFAPLVRLELLRQRVSLLPLPREQQGDPAAGAERGTNRRGSANPRRSGA